MDKRSIFLAIALSGLLVGCGDKGQAPSEPPPPEVTVGKAISRDLVEWDEYVGRLAAIDDVELRARVSGYLEKTHFKDGQMVKAGDLLFTIDPRPYQALVDRAKASVSEAEAALSLANSNLKRAETLLKSNAVSEEEVDIRRGNQLAATAELEAAKADLVSANLNLEFTEVKAPVDGRIDRDLVTPGNLVSGGSDGATLLTTIVSIDPIHCYFEADESDYLKYTRLDREGKRPSSRDTANPVELGLADEEGFPHKGEMDFVENAIDRDTSTIQGRAIFENTDKTLTPGLFARVRLRGELLEGAVQIPDTAIGRDQSENFVWVIDAENVANRRGIQTGSLIDGLRVITEGLESGERVVTNGLQRIRPGITVAPVEKVITPVGVEQAEAEAPESSTEKAEQ